MFSTVKMTDIQAANGVPGTDEGVIIYSPSKTPMQSGMAQTLEGKIIIIGTTTSIRPLNVLFSIFSGGAPAWRIALPTQSKWTNPLMGWTSTGDPLETMSRQMYFSTKEDAIAFCEKSGMKVEKVVDPPPMPKYRPKRFPGYGSNYDVNRLAGGTPIGGLRSELPTKK